MKTTIEISNPLFKEVKKFAQGRGQTFRSVTEEALRKYLSSYKFKPKKFRLKRGSYKGKGLISDLQEVQWAEIRQKIYVGRGE